MRKNSSIEQTSRITRTPVRSRQLPERASAERLDDWINAVTLVIARRQMRGRWTTALHGA